LERLWKTAGNSVEVTLELKVGLFLFSKSTELAQRDYVKHTRELKALTFIPNLERLKEN